MVLGITPSTKFVYSLKCHRLVTFGAEFSGNFLWLVTFL